jgi:hypothetical protein
LQIERENLLLKKDLDDLSFMTASLRISAFQYKALTFKKDSPSVSPRASPKAADVP